MPSRNRRHRQTRLCGEQLEARRLLAGDTGFSPWTHPLDPDDVTGDSTVTARDALVIINQLKRSQTAELADITAPPILGLGDDTDGTPAHYDSTGDGRVSARDALVVINRLNRADSLAGSPQAEAIDAAMRQAVGEQVDQTVTFRDGFSRIEGTLTKDRPSDTFRFTATRPRSSVDLSTPDDEQLAEIRVYNDAGDLIADSSNQPDRKPFEGLSFSTQAGAEYKVVVGFAGYPPASSAQFNYALSVFQFDASRWLPASSGEVIDVDGADGGDIGDTIATATDLAIRPNGSSFTQSLETPDDVDIYRLPNALPGSAFVSGLEGVTLDLLGPDGEVLPRQPQDLSLESDQDVGGYSNDSVPIEAESIYLRIASSAGAVGSYDASVLLEGPKLGDSGGDGGGSKGGAFIGTELLQQYDPATAEQIDLQNGQATISGVVQSRDQVDFYRFQSAAVRLEATLSAAAKTRAHIFRVEDSAGLDYVGPVSTRSTLLISRHDPIAERHYVVAVFNNAQSSDYQLSLELVQRAPTPDVSVSDLSGAVAFPPNETPVDDRGYTPVSIDAGAVNLYRVAATGPRIGLVLGDPLERDYSYAALDLQFHQFDGNGQLVGDTNDAVRDRHIEHLGARLGSQIKIVDTQPGQDILLRIANPTDQLINTQLRVSAL